MDFYKVPIGFGMALAINPPALNAYSAMTEEQSSRFLIRRITQEVKKKCMIS